MSGTQNGPTREDREAPGDSATNPTGAPAPDPAEGSDETPPERPGSPAG